MEIIGNFQEHRFALARNVIPHDLCAVVTRYARFRQQYFDEREDLETGQIPGTTSYYGDTLMETLMFFMHPHMERITGKKLCPTYTYFRIYKPGDELKRHSDRESCEISTSVCLGFDYKGVPSDYRWGLYVDPQSQHWEKRKMHDGAFVSDNREGVLITQNVGDCIIYTGTELEHWRDVFAVGEDSYHVQVFMHYIDMNGPFYPEFAFDQRPGIAAPLTLRRGHS